MTVWDGNKFDITNHAADKYLQINSCGFQNTPADFTVVRKKGRCDYHILLINSGICEVLYSGKLYTLSNGNLIIYAPEEEQRYTFKTESTSLWYHFTGRIVKELLESCSITGGVYLLKPNKVIFETYSELIRRFHQPGKEKYANAAFLEIIYHISDAATASNQRDKSDILLPILTYINANYNRHITLDELAKKTGYSKSRFSHLFSEITATTPIKYQNDIRLKVSCEMLSSTKQPVSEIAFGCGFSDPLYYSRIFRKKYNMSPTEYRLTINKS